MGDDLHWKVRPERDGRVGIHPTMRGVQNAGHVGLPSACPLCFSLARLSHHWAVTPDRDPRSNLPYDARGTPAAGHSRDARSCAACRMLSSQVVQVLLCVRDLGGSHRFVQPVPDVVLSAWRMNRGAFGMPPDGDHPHSQLVCARVSKAIALDYLEHEDGEDTSGRRGVKLTGKGLARIEKWQSEPK